MAKMKQKRRRRNATTSVRTRRVRALPIAPWFVFSIRCVALEALCSLSVLALYALKIGAALGAWQVCVFLIYSVATLFLVCLCLGVPFRFWGHDGKRGLDISAGRPPCQGFSPQLDESGLDS
jgi:ABC-type proline/glycine betaine transport system permease subunit